MSNSRTGGRPKQKVRKSRIIGVRLTHSEYHLVNGIAQRNGIPISEYVRNKILGHKLPQKPSDNKISAVRQLAGLSNNINQITKKLNSVGVYSGIQTELSKAIDELSITIRNLK